MLDKYTHPLVQHPLKLIARQLVKRQITANQITLIGFFIGLLAIPFLANEMYLAALVVILLNRVLDGLDGTLARLQGPSDAGGFLDIVLDFIFYSAVIFGFALANPAENALAASFLIFSFIGTGCSFLTFAIFSEKLNIEKMQFDNKSIHYIQGITEGTETIIFYCFICLLPAMFSPAALIFGLLCWLTTGIRVWAGFQTISKKQLP